MIKELLYIWICIKTKRNLKSLGLDLLYFISNSKRGFESFKNQGFDSILCSVDFDKYTKKGMKK